MAEEQGLNVNKWHLVWVIAAFAIGVLFNVGSHYGQGTDRIENLTYGIGQLTLKVDAMTIKMQDKQVSDTKDFTGLNGTVAGLQKQVEDLKSRVDDLNRKVEDNTQPRTIIASPPPQQSIRQR